MIAGETDVAVGDVQGLGDEVGSVLLDGLEDDFHVVAVDEDASVEAVSLTAEDEGAVGLWVDLGVFFDDL